MTSRIEHEQPELPGNHAQFGNEVATEAFAPMRATQRVVVKPVIPRRSPSRAVGIRPIKDLPQKSV